MNEVNNEINNEYVYNCDKCNYKCKYKSQWVKHCESGLHKTGQRKKRSDYKGVYKCDKCVYETKNTTMFKQHKLNSHSTIEEREKGFKYYCKICDFGSFSKDIMNNHNNSDKHKTFESRKLN